jgi:hypothetical protein
MKEKTCPDEDTIARQKWPIKPMIMHPKTNPRQPVCLT